MLLSDASSIPFNHRIEIFASFSQAPFAAIFVLQMMTKFTPLPAQKFLLYKEALDSIVTSIPTLSVVELDKMDKVPFEGKSRGPPWNSLPIPWWAVSD